MPIFISNLTIRFIKNTIFWTFSIFALDSKMIKTQNDYIQTVSYLEEAYFQ